MSTSDGVPRTLVLDTTCLSHFARADRIDVLGDLLLPFTPMTTDVVREEIRVGSEPYPEIASVLNLEWLSIEATNSLDRISRFVLWTQRVGAGQRNLGEASVLAIAEELGAIAIIDDRDATRVGRAYGVQVHGTLWLLANSCRMGKLTLVNACNLIDSLTSAAMRLPCTGAQFPEFAKKHGLL